MSALVKVEEVAKMNDNQFNTLKKDLISYMRQIKLVLPLNEFGYRDDSSNMISAVIQEVKTNTSSLKPD